MNVRRIVSNISCVEPEQSYDFYAGFLGLQPVMERDEIITFAMPGNAQSQISVIRRDDTDVPEPNISIEVADVDATYAQAVAQGLVILYPLTDEPWGVRRFFVADPNGAVINILSHR